MNFHPKQTKQYRQKELQLRFKDEDVPSLDELDRLINNITFGKKDPERQTAQAKALIAIYYLTACRVSEITTPFYLRKYKTQKLLDGTKKQIIIEKVKQEFLGVRKEDITFDTINGKRCMFIRTENRKNKQKKTKKQPIPIELESKLSLYLEKYLSTIMPGDFLFNFGCKRATQIINETIKWNPHFIRHIRATHLIVLYDFNEQMLISFMGWTDGRPAKNYMELNKKDLFNAFYKNKGGNNERKNT